MLCAACVFICGATTGCGDGATCATPVAGAAVGALGAGAADIGGYDGSMLALPGSTAIPGLLTPAEPASWHGLPLRRRLDERASTYQRSSLVQGCMYQRSLHMAQPKVPLQMMAQASERLVHIGCSGRDMQAARAVFSQERAD